MKIFDVAKFTGPFGDIEITAAVGYRGVNYTATLIKDGKGEMTADDTMPWIALKNLYKRIAADMADKAAEEHNFFRDTPEINEAAVGYRNILADLNAKRSTDVTGEYYRVCDQRFDGPSEALKAAHAVMGESKHNGGNVIIERVTTHRPVQVGDAMISEQITGKKVVEFGSPFDPELSRYSPVNGWIIPIKVVVKEILLEQDDGEFDFELFFNEV